MTIPEMGGSCRKVQMQPENAAYGVSGNSCAPESIKEHIGALRQSVLEMQNFFANFSPDLGIGDFYGDLAALDVLLARFSDKNFRLGITGEFSAGKSAFINALVERRCLAEDIIQGTTKTRTILKNSGQERISAINRDGSVRMWEMEGRTDEEISALLAALTASSQAEREIREVVWESAFPLRDIILVDMPGLGSVNPHHAEIAAETAAMCDGLLVLANLNMPLSASLLRDVEAMAGQKAQACVFVGTFSDQLSSGQTEKMKSFFSSRLRQRFGRECAFYFVSAVCALEELGNVVGGVEEKCQSLRYFRKFRNTVYGEIKKSAPFFKACRIAREGAAIASAIERKLLSVREKIGRQLTEIAESPVPIIMWSEIQERLEDTFRNGLEGIRKDICRQGKKELETFEGALLEKIYSFTASSELNRYVNDRLSDDLDEFCRHFQKRMLACIARRLSAKFKSALESRENEPALASGENHGNRKRWPESLAPDMRPVCFELKSVSGEFDAEENFKIGGGFGLGLGLAMLVPGIGWLAGGLLAAATTMLGAGCLTSLEGLKKKYGARIHATFTSLLTETAALLADAHDGMALEMESEFARIVGRMKKRHEESLAMRRRPGVEQGARLRAALEFAADYGARMELFAASLENAARCQKAG